MHPAEQQMQFVYTLRSRGVTNAEVLKAMEATPRVDFLEGIFQERAFEDTPLPIACGQTISQPTVVGLMTQALERHAALQGARGRDRLGLPGGDPRAPRATGLHRSSGTGGWRDGRASSSRRSGCTTSPSSTATARSACPSRRPSTGSS